MPPQSSRTARVAVLLDRLDLLVHVEMSGRRRAGAVPGGLPGAR